MEKVVLDVPMLWADHPVLAVRDALMQLAGVEDVYASAAWKQVMVTYDAAKLDQAAIEGALAAAGYPAGDGATPVLVLPDEIHRDPQWNVLGARLTKTNQNDIAMSGEFRRY